MGSFLRAKISKYSQGELREINGQGAGKIVVYFKAAAKAWTVQWWHVFCLIVVELQTCLAVEGWEKPIPLILIKYKLIIAVVDWMETVSQSDLFHRVNCTGRADEAKIIDFLLLARSLMCQPS